MVRKLFAFAALVLALGMSVMPAAAQDIDTSELEDMGLESGYMRMYMADGSSATADASLMGIMAGGFQFDSADTAGEAFEDFACGFAGGFLGNADATDCDSLSESGDVTVTENDSIGDKAIEVTGTADIAGPTDVTMLMVQDEEFVFVVINLGVAEAGSADAFAQYMVDADPSDAEVVFNEDGTSTGGIFDMLPQDGDAELEGLAPMTDMDLVGAATSTPEA